jgi:DNA replication protein DnaC
MEKNKASSKESNAATSDEKADEGFSDDLKYECKICGRVVYPIAVNGQRYRGLCECESSIIVNKNLEEMNKRAAVKKLGDFYRVNPKLSGASLEAFVKREGTEGILKTSKDYVDNIKERVSEGEGTLFCGNPGTGKSFLSGAIANTAIKLGYTVVYQPVPELLSSIRKTYGKKKLEDGELTEWDILEGLYLCDILILDDIGAEKYSEWVESILYMIISRRYDTKKPIIASTNCSLKELEERLGRRSIDRIIEMCRIAECRATSYRWFIAKERTRREK